VTITAAIVADQPPATAASEVRHATTRLADRYEAPSPAGSRQPRERKRDARAVLDKITAAPGLDLDQEAAHASPMNTDAGYSVDVDAPEVLDQAAAGARWAGWWKGRRKHCGHSRTHRSFLLVTPNDLWSVR